MHELAITSSIVELVAEAACGRRVRRVLLEVGKLSGVVAEAIAFCFPEIARGTAAEAARLDIREIEGRARCETCDGEFPLVDLLATCPCGSVRYRPIAGQELNLKSIELEEAA
ncbi:MAG TPA: hydrogenase maturation nickel metallochaperone HypA [Stellaceae bacterium]|jgi:hydrogenase nickel incorporation protein HypA/HybF|nr:hydrogenase maturation nickel metallochaperone HypA [Stellaceae bacterium]